MPLDASSLALEPWQWALAALGAFCIGLSKTGVAGLGIASIALFAVLLPPRESVGIVLLILIGADVVAVLSYRRHADWGRLGRLFPWAAAGVLLGYLAMGRIDEAQIKRLIGGILVLMVIAQWVQRRRAAAAAPAAGDGDPDANTPNHAPWVVGLVGTVAGFTTMVANAAGPIMILYLLAMRLPKMSFIGTSAWFFLVLNLFKVPFNLGLGLINPGALRFALTLFPCALAGGLSGRLLIRHIDQKLFETLALALTLAAGLRLLF